MPVSPTPGKEWRNREIVTGSVTIASGANTSNAFRLENRAMLQLFAPSGIAGSIFTFQVEDHAGAYKALYDTTGSQTQTIYGSDRAVGLDLTGALVASKSVKVVTGPVGSLNTQADTMIIGYHQKS